MKILAPDSKFMIFLTVLCDLALIGILTFVCCIPVITAGAAFTAKDRMCYRVLKGEGTGIVRDFFISFKTNLRQATFIWIMEMAVLLFFVLDVYLLKIYAGETGLNIIYILTGLLFFAYVMTIMVFPMLSRFENTVSGTLKNALTVSASIFPGAVLMGILYLIPPAVAAFFPGIIPFAVLFGSSGPGYLSAVLYRGCFEKLESAYFNKLNRNSHFDEAEVETLGQIDE